MPAISKKVRKVSVRIVSVLVETVGFGKDRQAKVECLWFNSFGIVSFFINCFVISLL